MSIDTIKNYFADTHCSCVEQKKKKKSWALIWKANVLL